ncbi:MAG: hypothetical protein M3P10_08665 [Actinomycetota bacterium]|nr:hypothetical protein [Actinomycetota bacterium]
MSTWVDPQIDSPMFDPEHNEHEALITGKKVRWEVPQGAFPARGWDSQGAGHRP